MTRWLNTIAVFRGTDPSALQQIEEAAQHLRLGTGELLCRQGDRDDALYVVLSGTLQVDVTLPEGRQRRLAPLGAGDCDGESTVLFQKPRYATVCASIDAELLRIPAKVLHLLFAADPAAHQRFLELASRRWLSGQLARLPLFDDVDLTTVDQLGGDVHWHHLAGGETLFRQGDPPDYLYIVVHGRLEVIVKREDGEHAVAWIGPGESVGEMALLTGEPRSATVRAVRDSVLARISRQELDLLLHNHPPAVRTIARTLVQRLHNTTAEISATPRVATIAVVPSQQQGFPSGFIEAFVRALSAVAGATLHLDRRRLDLEFDGRSNAMLADPTLHSPLLAWLHEQEDRFQHLVFEAEPAASPWTDLCLRQADVVLLVASADSDPRPGSVEQGMAQPAGTARRAPVHLVLVHPDGSRPPSGTARWINSRQLQAHHHVRSGCVEDFARLARAATGRAVGVVFGGGGARGYLHLGVVQALREREVPIDAVGGTSIGALAAAQCARGLTTKEMIEAGTTGHGKKLGVNLLRDTTLPIVAFLSGRRAVRMLEDVFGDTHIEDLWLPYFCVSANLSTARVVVHDRGLLWLAIRASLSIPGILPPVLVNGEMLVDGGLLNNLPVNAMRTRAGTVVAVDVASPVDLTVASPACAAVSGWSQMWRRINPFGGKPSLPNIFDILTRATTLGAIHNTEVLKKQADLYLHPIATQVDVLDWTAGRALIDVGYQHAVEEIDRWKARRHA